MFHRLRRRAEDEKGFTLIELLVVILIIGILAAIAIPSFLNQKTKANDAAAKSMARTAQTASETYATDHNGSYSGLSTAAVQTIEPTLSDTSGASLVSASSADGVSYTVVASSHAPDNNTFTIIRTSTGAVTRACTTAGSGGCLAGGSW